MIRSARAVPLGALTVAKTASNTALRWVGPFLPTLERAFGASTGALTGVMGVAELGGLSTTVTGRYIDRGHERRVFLLGMSAAVLSSVIALTGSLAAFAASFAILVVGVSNLTVAGHAWIGHRVAFSRRGRAIGVFEMSWAVALLVGAPVLALLIEMWGWRAAYAALALAAVAGIGVVFWLVPGDVVSETHDRPRGAALPRSAWPPMLTSAATAASGLAVFVVSGAWLDDAHDVSTGGLGLIAAGFGAMELVSSSTVALISDRVGARRSVAAGLMILLCGAALMWASGDSRVLAIAGLIVFLAGFEYGFVSSLTLVTEAAPASRGRAIGIANAIGTVARAGAVFASGQLYEAFGMTGTLTMIVAMASVALVMLAVSPHPEQRHSSVA